MSQSVFPCVVEVILLETRRGDGSEKEPTRIITQVFTKDGKFIAEYDPSVTPHKDTPKK